MKRKCAETLDGNRWALVEECSLPAVTSNLCEAVAKIIKESHASVIDGAKSFEGQGHKSAVAAAVAVVVVSVVIASIVVSVVAVSIVVVVSAVVVISKAQILLEIKYVFV